MNFENLMLTDRDGIATLTVKRPDKLNALNEATLSELETALESVDAATDIRALIVTGAGEKAFVAGADIKELAELSAEGGHLAARRGQAIFRKLETLGKPVLAAVNGFALGGGLELALACHIRLASDTAKLGLPEVGLGAIPGYGGTQRLARLVGSGRALEMILSAQPVDAAEAHRIGLVNRVVPNNELATAADDLARKIIKNAPGALRSVILAVNRGLDADLETGLEFEATLFGVLAGSDDWREGMKAFVEKRPPKFTGR